MAPLPSRAAPYPSCSPPLLLLLALLLLLCSPLLLVPAFAAGGHSADEWQSRTIYQLVTDRFALPPGTPPGPLHDFPHCLHTYCGGTFTGVTARLDYISALGFDAIWISPVVTNTPDGFHGYWTQNFNTIESHLGTAQELQELVQACHQRDIWVMVDVVFNHVGPVGGNYSTIVPFNETTDYHRCDGTCPSTCNINFDNGNQTQVELCRLSGLPDLDQSNPSVRQFLKQWVRELIAKYDFDGLRIDTVPEIAKPFWKEIQTEVGTFAIGEVYNGAVDYVAGYQGPNALNSVLSYPLFFTLRDVFLYRHSGGYAIQDVLQQYASHFRAPSLLGTFVGNHDQARWLSVSSDSQLLQNALTYLFFGEGIPIFYYGTEQGFDGGNDPYNREPLWRSKYSTTSPYFRLTQLLTTARKKHAIATLPMLQNYADDQFYAFSRGNASFVALTNVGSEGPDITRDIDYHEFAEGTKLCNLFWGDCVLVEQGKFTVTLLHGESKVLVPV